MLHGLEATGKSSVTRAVLEELSASEITDSDEGTIPQGIIRYTIVKSAECISGRHLLEQTIGSIAKATDWKGDVARCENLAQLVVEVEKLLRKWFTSENGTKRFVLVLDGIDHQREAPPTLSPALARLVEIVSYGLAIPQNIADEIDTKSHNSLHCHLPTSEFPPFIWRSSH